VVAIETGALATSSTTVRRWRRGDRILHHLVDPRTGGPVVSPWRTASVVAASCVDANTAATAAIVLGDSAIAWLDAAGLAARLVAEDGSITRVGGWPEPARRSVPAWDARRGPRADVTGSKGEAGEHSDEAIRGRPTRIDGAPSP